MQSFELHHDYLLQWAAGVERSLSTLEPADVADIESVQDVKRIRDLLTDLGYRSDGGYPDEDALATKHAVVLILPSLAHFGAFNSFLLQRLAGSPSRQSSPLWGLFHLALQLASAFPEKLRLVGDMVKQLGQRIEILNEFCKAGQLPAQMAVAALDVYLELAGFFVSTIRFFRLGEPLDPYGNSWQGVIQAYNETLQNIDDIFRRFEQLTRVAKKSMVADEFPRQQRLLSLSDGGALEAKLPCIMLPPAKNARFYDRDNIIDRIDANFNPLPDGERTFRSLVLYGIGGVGKSHVALKYAHAKITRRSVDAVLWLYSETESALAQSFSAAAAQLHLRGTVRGGGHDENRILVLNWLQQTDASWLVVFDNAEDADLLLRYWPPACRAGSILVTSRNRNLQYGPAEDGIEIPSFDSETGSKLLLHLLRMDVAAGISSAEVQSAWELAGELDGHALAISFMAGLIQKRSWSIQKFLSMYERNKRDLHARGPNSLATIWQLSFESLDDRSAAVLGILSYVNPDSVPAELLTRAEAESLPPALRDCAGRELDFDDAFEPLLTLSLVKRDKETGAFSTHRLVQTQYRYFLSLEARQHTFEHTVELLRAGFGDVYGQLYDRWGRCQLYMQQILSLKSSFKKEQSERNPIRPTPAFCYLLRNSSRYLIEAANYADLEDVLAVGQAAFDKLSPPERAEHKQLQAGILDNSGLLWGHRAFFQQALSCMRASLQIKEEDDPAQSWMRLSWGQVNFGNLQASLGNYADALKWELRAEQTRITYGGDDRDRGAQAAQAVLHQNIARCHAFLNQVPQAQERLRLSLGALEGSENWAMMAFTLYVQANLERKLGHYAAARATYLRAQTAWLEGSSMRTHHFRGACLYKLGCVCNDMGDTEEAIRYLREALVVAKMKEEIMAGDYARVLYKLSQILEKRPETMVEAAEKAAEALRIRLGGKLSLRKAESDSGRTAVSDHAALDDQVNGPAVEETKREKPFDDLVYILWR